MPLRICETSTSGTFEGARLFGPGMQVVNDTWNRCIQAGDLLYKTIPPMQRVWNMATCHVCGMTETGGMIVAWNLIDFNLKDEYPDLQPYTVSHDLMLYFSKKVMPCLECKTD